MSKSDHAMASRIVVLPAPFSPVMAVMPRSKLNSARSYDLMLSSSTLVTCILKLKLTLRLTLLSNLRLNHAAYSLQHSGGRGDGRRTLSELDCDFLREQAAADDGWLV